MMILCISRDTCLRMHKPMWISTKLDAVDFEVHTEIALTYIRHFGLTPISDDPAT